MDDMLLTKIKVVISQVQSIFDKEYGEIDSEEQAKLYVQKAYNTLIKSKDAKVLYKINESITQGNNKYLTYFDSLDNFIVDSVKLSAHLCRLHNHNIRVTAQNIANKNNKFYMQKREFKEPIEELLDYNDKVDKFLKNSVLSLSYETKQIYDGFGKYKNDEEEKAIIKKESRHSNTYMQKVKSFGEYLYEPDAIDNYESMICDTTGLTNELVQLYTDLLRSFDYKFGISNTEIMKTNANKSTYFVIMDVKGSRKMESIEEVYKRTIMLNMHIQENPNLEVVCPFRKYKLDEIQGVIFGERETFLRQVEKTYGEIKLWYGMSKLPITNIEDSIYGVPFELYGPACIEAREEIEEMKNMNIKMV